MKKDFILNSKFYLNRQIPAHNRSRWIRQETGQRIFLLISDCLGVYTQTKWGDTPIDISKMVSYIYLVLCLIIDI